MYNLQVKNDYSSYDAGNKTSIRNKKSRASQDANFVAQVDSAKRATKNAFSFEKLTPAEKAREQSADISMYYTIPQTFTITVAEQSKANLLYPFFQPLYTFILQY